jgi:hypothetical protein
VDISITEFPFVGELPKRERSAIRRIWDDIHEVVELQRQVGPVLPVGLAADALGVSASRVCQIAAAGRLEQVAMNGKNFIVAASLLEFAKLEKSKGGRPCKAAEGDFEKASMVIEAMKPKKRA